jgi:hypothetical protein
MSTRVMPYRGMELFDNCSALQATVATGTTETMILGSAISRLDQNSEAVVVNGVIYLIPGKGCTGIVVRFREGYGLAGAIELEPVGLTPAPGGIAVVPGVVNAIPISGILDAAYQQGPNGGQYSITVQQCGTDVTGNATIVNANISWWNAAWWDLE